MPPARIIAISPDEDLGAKLAAALAELGEVSVHGSVEAAGGEAALWVIHHRGDAEPVVPASGRTIVVLPRSNLAVLVDLMRASERVGGMLVEDAFDPRALATIARRIVTGDVFGLTALVAPGTELHSERVRDARDRSPCIGRIVQLAQAAGAPKGQQTAIEQCIDEMLMNALYDAPVDAEGTAIFAGVAARERLALRIDQTVVVEYACDGAQLAMSVRDAYGSLARHTVLAVLHKCLHAAQKIDRKAGGAGVGLYLMATSASAVHFHVVPGVATEAACVFQLRAARQQLARFAYLEEPRDVTGTLASARRPAGAVRPERLADPSKVRRRRVLAGAIVAAALAGGVVAHRVLREPPPPPPPATVALDSQPTGAAIAIDGVPMGDAPLDVTSLEPGRTVEVTFARRGYEPATARVVVPARGERTRLVQRLATSPRFARVRFVTEPPGARVLSLDEPPRADRTFTPAELFLEVGRIQRFVLVMPGYAPLAIEPFTPAPGGDMLEKGGALVRGTTLRIEAAAPGRVTVSGAPHCANAAVPLVCTLAPGTYEVAYVAPGARKATRTIEVTDRDATIRFDRY